ncbi:hypothetical protein ABZ543_12805 [Streptomyces roseifaciens]
MSLNDDTRALMAEINKKHGPGSVIVASQMPRVPRFPSGSLSLDAVLGGGWPGNQWCEIIGSESSGKTTVVHKTIAANQRRDPDFVTFWIASEGYDEAWARALGVDTDRVIPFFTNAMEDAYAAMIQAVESRAVDAVVLDSYPALVASAEDEKAMHESTISAGARVTAKFCRKAGSASRRSLIDDERPFLGLVINQWRDQIGGFSPHGGTPKITPGGKAKNYFFSTRLEVQRTEWIDEKRPTGGVKRVGQCIKLKTIKNKTAAPQQVATIRFYFADSLTGHDKGDYDTGAEMATMGIFHGVITAEGAWYKYDGAKWHGMQKLCAALREDIDLQETLRADVMAAIEAAP